MEALLHDLRVGSRLLWKHKAFSLTATLTLALCIGANTALFSVVNSVLLRPLPVPESDRVVIMENLYPGAGVNNTGNAGVPDFYDRLRETDVFEAQSLDNHSNVSIDEHGTPVRIHIQNVTPSYFDLLRVSAALGRTFAKEEGEPGNEKKIVLGYTTWQSRFGGDRNVVGRDLRMDSQPYTIVGVMPQSFQLGSPDTALWRPLAFTPQQKADDQRHSNNYRHLGRLKPGRTVEQAQAELDALNRANLDRFPQYRQVLVNAGFRTRVSRLQDILVQDIRPSLYLMWGGALFVLLIGCVNVANLVLVRSRARLKELATRLALGASRTRIAQQLVTESLLLTLASAALGLLVGHLALRALSVVNIQDLPRGSEIRMDGVVVAYTLAIAAIIGTVLGLIPAGAVIPLALTTALREEGRTGSSGRGARNLRRVLVAAQVAVAFVLLVGSGLLFASFRHILAIDPGFNPDGVLTASINLPRTRYKTDDQLRTFTDEALRRIRALPGVAAAGATNVSPLSGDHNDSLILAEGYQMQPGESVISPSLGEVTPGYFEAMGVTLRRGRFFDERDVATAPRVIIVDEKLARHFWPDQDPIGRRMYFPTDINHLLVITDKTQVFAIVGVIGSIKLDSLIEPRTAVGAYYFPMAQRTSHGVTFALKTSGDPHALTGAVRSAINQVDAQLPVFATRTMQEWTERSLVSRRSPVLLSLAFSAVALFLSAIGIYGVLAYVVTQRTREIGIRIALGSSARGVFELVLKEGFELVGAGLAVGAVGALALRRTLESQLYDVRATDPVVGLSVLAILGAVALFACAIPAQRATKIDPIVALTE